MQVFANVVAKVLAFDWIINLVIGILLLVAVGTANNAILSGLAFVVFGILLVAEAVLKFFVTYIVKPV